MHHAKGAGKFGPESDSFNPVGISILDRAFGVEAHCSPWLPPQVLWYIFVIE